MSSEALEESDGAAVHALPVDLFASVRLADGLTSANLPEEATLAQKVLLLCLLAGGLLAVNETTEERRLALVTLVESAAVHGKLLRLVEVVVSRSRDALIVEDALLFCTGQSRLLDTFLEREERAKLIINGLGIGNTDFHLLLTVGTSHEAESDPEGGPLVLEELNNAVGVENMAAGEAGTGLSAELAGVADSAELILINTLIVTSSLGAVSVQARKAFLVILDAFASMTALKSLAAESEGSLRLACVDLNLLLLLNLLLFFSEGKDRDLNFNFLRGGRWRANQGRSSGLKHPLVSNIL
jgi:hypothetical protein